MRVANRTIYEIVKSNLGNITVELSKANKVVSTGKRMTGLSDDPAGLVQSLKIRSALLGLEQLGRNITMGKSWLTASEHALVQVQNVFSDVKALCVQMANATAEASKRTAGAENVKHMLAEIISLTNTKVNGHYIFSGSKTDSAPFGFDGVYKGDNKAFSVKIGRETTIEVGNNGEAVFGSIFSTLDVLINALEGNHVRSIGEAMSNLDDHFDHVSTKISDIGAKLIRMEFRENVFQNLNVSQTDRLAKIEDADIAEAIIALKEKEVAYQAALASSAKVMALSLVDYL